MASLSTNDKQSLEKLFQMGDGYVLNFFDRTLGEFFSDDIGINIYDERYNYGSGSKANRLRAFWRVASDALVGNSIQKLVEYIENQILIGKLKQEDFPTDLIQRGRDIADRLLGFKSQTSAAIEIREDDFLSREFKNISIDKLGLDSGASAVLQQRIEEIKKCLNAKASLAAIFLCGSTLEGILLGIASKRPKDFNMSNQSPRDASGKVLPLQKWSLADFINVARGLDLVGEDVKKFSHALRDFRNYIHPFEQLASGFNPDEHTATICWQVLQAAIVQLSREPR